MKLDFDFFNLYDNLSDLNEGILMEADTKEFGKYKKAFVNFINGVYYDENGELQGKDSDVQGTKYAEVVKDIHDIYEIAKAYDIPTYKVDPDRPDRKVELTPEELVKEVNKVLGRSGARAISLRTKDSIEKGIKSYTVFKLAPAVLHHIDGEHDHNVGVRPYKYDTGNGKKPTYLVDLSKSDTANNLGNYVLIQARDAKSATYVHMIIHLVALVSKALGLDNPDLEKVIDAFSENIAKKNAVFTYIDKNKEKKETTSLKDFLLTSDCYGASSSTNARLTSGEEEEIPIAAVTVDDPAEEAVDVEVPVVTDSEEE